MLLFYIFLFGYLTNFSLLEGKAVLPQDSIVHYKQQRGSEEEKIHTIRQQKASPIFQQLLPGIPADQLPTIGIVGSGGGMRAALSLLHFLIELERLGLLDLATHIATASGSSWLLASWLNWNTSLQTLRAHLEEKLSSRLRFSDLHTIIMQSRKSDPKNANTLLCKLWGNTIAELLLKDGCKNQDVLSSFSKQLATGNYPYPLFTTTLGTAAEEHNDLCEYTPHYVSLPCYHDISIPTYALNYYFNDGVITNKNPEPPLSFLLGLFGSAYAITPQDAHRKLAELWSHTLDKTILMKHALKTTDWVIKALGSYGSVRFYPPSINNFMFQIKNAPYNDQQHLPMIDAGIMFNLPIIPLLRRKINLYFICDSSFYKSKNSFAALKTAAAYAKKHNYPFPAIDYNKINSDRLNLFYDPTDKQIPVVLYLTNPLTFPTSKMHYNRNDFYLISKTIKAIMESSIPLINEGLSRAAYNASNNKNISYRNNIIRF